MKGESKPPLKRTEKRSGAFLGVSLLIPYLSLALLLAAFRIAHGDILLDTRYQYDAMGQPTATINGAGHADRNAWDALGRLQSQTNPLNHSTTYRYQANDALTRVQAPNGAVTTWTVDGFGQAADETSPDRGLTRYQYDAAGNLTQRIDARGAQIDTTYDALNRPLEQRIYRPDQTLEATHLYTWDRPPHGIGRLDAIEVGPNRLAFDYDLAGHVITRAYTRGAVALAVHSAYDATTGQRDTLTYPSGSVIQYQYDVAGRVTALTWDGQPIADQLQYTAFGALSALRLANGLLNQRTYDTAGRLKSYTLANDVYQLTYDAAGQLITLTPPDPSGQQHFSYDATGRLIGYQGQTHSESYGYDPNGNRQQRTQDGQSTLYQYLANSNRLQSINAVTLSHDAAGNRTLDLTRHYTHDSTGRLTQLTQGPTLARYEYNGLGERVLKQLGSELRHFAYDDQGHLLGEYDATGQPLAEYAWFQNLPLAYRVYRTVNGLPQIDLYTIEADHLGTPRLLTDAAQHRRWRWDSTPFGDTPPLENPENLGAITFNLRFPGQYADPESGLFYNYFRYYDAQTGRYAQSDLIGLDGGINTYAYVGGNPISRIDPTGELFFIPALIAGLIEGGVTAEGAVALGGLIVGGAGLWGATQSSGGDSGAESGTGSSPTAGEEESSNSRAAPVPYPERKRSKYTCNCRANRDGRSPDNCSIEDQQSAIGYGEGDTLQQAKKAAEKAAKDKLGAKSTHHVTCRCRDPKGNPIIPTR